MSKDTKPSADLPREYQPPPSMGRPRANTKIWEPHQYNKHVLEKQRARGEEPNIPRPESLGRTHTVSTKPVKQVDLRKLAAQEANRRRAEVGGDAGVEPYTE